MADASFPTPQPTPVIRMRGLSVWFAGKPRHLPWNRQMKGLWKMVRKVHAHFGPGAVMTEVGCYSGQSTAVFARAFGSVVAVDPWKSGYDQDDPASSTDMARVEALFDRRMRRFSNVKKWKCDSDEAAHRTADQSVDFIYLDAVHTEEATTADIRRWLPKLRPDGILGGHDYVDGWPGVKRAVDGIFGKPDRVFADGSWLIFNASERRQAPLRRIFV